MKNNGYALLATAVIWQALKDYDKALKAFEQNPANKKAFAEIAEIEDFFKSDWFLTLREMEPETISVNILEEFKNDSKRVLKTGIYNRQEHQSKGKRAGKAKGTCYVHKPTTKGKNRRKPILQVSNGGGRCEDTGSTRVHCHTDSKTG